MRYALPPVLAALAVAACASPTTPSVTTAAPSKTRVEAESVSSPVWADVHGAGSQRSDPKTGDPSNFSHGHGPQGDSIRITNLVRAVRSVSRAELRYTVVDTSQTMRFDNVDVTTNEAVFAGQDADYQNVAPTYVDNGDGTVTDLNTGLMWQKNPGKKLSWDEAHAKLKSIALAGHSDWRIPSIKELYSLMQFSGRDVSPQAASGNVPFIDANFFDFTYGDPKDGERVIDSQYMSSTKYVSTTMRGEDTVFGVNFADGRIKGYGMRLRGRDKTFFVMFVRGNPAYGKNDFVDNGDGTVSDMATGLMWMKDDAGPMNWQGALAYGEGLSFAGHDDWRLPDVKELQSLVDYERSPATTNSAAINPVFACTTITNEAGVEDFGYYWSSTTHASAEPKLAGAAAAYVAFGRSLGNLSKIQMPGPPPAEGR